MLLLVVAAAITATPLPSEKELGDALAFSQTCIDTDGMTNCSGPLPLGATFAQYLCVEYGADQAKHVIVRCVYKGARMTMRFPFGRTSAVPIGDGAIDVIHFGGSWLPSN